MSKLSVNGAERPLPVRAGTYYSGVSRYSSRCVEIHRRTCPFWIDIQEIILGDVFIAVNVDELEIDIEGLIGLFVQIGTPQSMGIPRHDRVQGEGKNMEYIFLTIQSC